MTPTSCKAVVIHRYGAAEEMRLADVRQPVIRPYQMLVKVFATSLNPIDWKIRQGQVRLLTGNTFPMILGFDVSGEVVQVGDRVTRFRPGDAIYAQLSGLPGGAYAEYAAVSEQVAALKPGNMTHVEAAAVPLAALTALQALRDLGRLEVGQTVLINGASGGVGTFAVQIAKALGADVTAVCRGKNAELVKQLGADRVIDYTRQDFTQEAIQYDIVFDVVGQRSLSNCKPVLQPKGIYITTQPYPKNYWQSLLTRFTSGPSYKVVVVKPSGDDLAYLKVQIEAGRIRSVIDRTYPLSEAAAAHAYSETGRAVGKIVLTIAAD